MDVAHADLEKPRYGLGLRYRRSAQPRRVAILPVIAAMATFAPWLAGIVATAGGWARSHQANSEKKRRFLYIVSLGTRVIRAGRRTPTMTMLQQALSDLENMAVTTPGTG